MTAAALTLEQRRQVLLATVSLQRFALRADIGTWRARVRASLEPVARPGWIQPTLHPSVPVVLRWVMARLWRGRPAAR